MQSEYYNAGFERGYNVASWVDMPDYGDKLPIDVDWVGIGTIETDEDLVQAFEILASAAEEHDRCFSPFEHTALEINESDNPDENWAEFDEGIADGIGQNVRERLDATNEWRLNYA